MGGLARGGAALTARTATPQQPTMRTARDSAAGWLLADTPVGACGLAWTADGRLAGAQLPAADAAGTTRLMLRRFGGVPSAGPAWVEAWAQRLRAVMAGAPDALLDIPLADAHLPPFARRVWARARQIPPGQTLTYGALAQALGEPGAARAVGQALGANPFAPIVPCHRVLAAHGQAGGFSAPGGRQTKLRLLQAEQARLGWADDQPGLF